MVFVEKWCFGTGFSTRLAVSVEKLSEELVEEFVEDFVEEGDGKGDDLLLFTRDHMVASLANAGIGTMFPLEKIPCMRITIGHFCV